MPEYSAESLIQQADKALDSLEYGLAIQFLERAFQSQPSPQTALRLGCLLAEAGPESQDPEQGMQLAKQWLEQAIQLSTPEWSGRIDCCLALGQLATGMQAVEQYELAINQLRELIVVPGREPGILKELCSKLSGALCAVTEVYMTDLWYSCCRKPLKLTPGVK